MNKFIIPAAAAASFLVAASMVGWLLSAYLDDMTVGTLFAEASIATKLAMMLVVIGCLPIAGLATADLVTGRGMFRTPLAILGIVAIVIGGLGAAYTVMTIQMAIAAVGPVSFAVTAPGYAEAALSAALGLFGGAFAFAARVLGDRRGKVSVREA